MSQTADAGVTQDPKADEVQRRLNAIQGVYSSLSKGWRRTIDQAIKEPGKWSMHDGIVQTVVSDFKASLKASGAPEPALDWRLIKAMLWVESGADRPAWTRSPMQIGNPNDAGMGVVLAGKEHINLILPASGRACMSAQTITTQPISNIRAGVAYLLNRMSVTEPFEVADPDRPEIGEHVVTKGETLDAIGKHYGASSKWLAHINGSATLKIGQKVKVQRTNRGVRIVSWRAFTPESLATYYNGGGDSHYASKLRYASEVMQLAERVVHR